MQRTQWGSFTFIDAIHGSIRCGFVILLFNATTQHDIRSCSMARIKNLHLAILAFLFAIVSKWGVLRPGLQWLNRRPQPRPGQNSPSFASSLINHQEVIITSGMSCVHRYQFQCQLSLANSAGPPVPSREYDTGECRLESCK